MSTRAEEKMDSAILFYTVLLASVVGFSSAYSIPFNRPCKDMSPGCLKESIQAALPAVANGVPELGLESLDPYILKQLLKFFGENIKSRSILQSESKVKSDGQNFLEIKSSDIDGEVSDTMSNLFENNDAILDIINSKLKMIAEKFGKPIIEYGVNCVLKHLRKVLQGKSIDELREFI